MAFTLLKLLLYLFGLTVLVVTGSIIFLGPDATAQYGAVIADILLGDTSSVDGLNSVNTDSELRFYSGIFAGYGLILIHTATTLYKNIGRVPFLAGVMLLGGIGRAFSFYHMGPPHGLFQILLMVEFLAPMLVLFIYPAARKSTVRF